MANDSWDQITWILQLEKWTSSNDAKESLNKNNNANKTEDKKRRFSFGKKND
jgi:hypothetical protein